MHCCCHQLQLALSTIKWKVWHCLQCGKRFITTKKAEKLTEIQSVPELKPSDTRWLAREWCVRAVWRSLPALVLSFQQIYDENGDAEAYELAKLLHVCICSVMYFILLPSYGEACKQRLWTWHQYQVWWRAQLQGFKNLTLTGRLSQVRDKIKNYPHTRTIVKNTWQTRVIMMRRLSRICDKLSERPLPSVLGACLRSN